MEVEAKHVHIEHEEREQQMQTYGSGVRIGTQMYFEPHTVVKLDLDVGCILQEADDTLLQTLGGTTTLVQDAIPITIEPENPEWA